MTDVLLQVNGLLIAAVLIVSFSLLSYTALHNWRSDVARAICVLLLSVTIVYGGDVLLSRAEGVPTIEFLLRAQWLGIALVPAAYVHLSYALLRASRGNGHIRRNRVLVVLSYAGSLLFLVLALSTDLVVHGGISRSILAQFQAGPLFWLYVLFFVASMVVTLHAIMRARRNALTPTLRRRLTYLRDTFAGPGVGVFPYLVVAEGNIPFSHTVTLVLLAVVSTGIIGMITVMTYSVGFQGVFMPDRLIKQDFIRWGLYGPVVGVTIILCIQLVPWLDNLLGLPADTLITFVVMIMTVLMPILISQVRPYLDALVYMQDQEEIDYLRGLPRSIFTSTDLRQLLENTLIAVCGAVYAETGFVAGPGKGGYTIKVLCGSRGKVKQFVAEHPLGDLMQHLEREKPYQVGVPPHTDAMRCGDFWLLPLRSPDGMFLGALGVDSPYGNNHDTAITPESRHLIDVITHHMELALTTAHMQQRIFETLRDLGPEMQSLQHLATRLDQATPATLNTTITSDEEDVLSNPQFPQLVKDVLTHYWGGPKLTDSPLLQLRTVRRLIEEEGGSPTRAMQAVLRQAITNLRPEEQLDPSAQEWMLYNILELRFLQGKRIRDVTNRLAMSESDFYRKQRAAVEEVARQIALMEDGEKTKL